MIGYQDYNYDAVVNGITLFMDYAQGQTPINYTYSLSASSDKTFIVIDFDFMGHLLPGAILALGFNDFSQDNTTAYYLMNSAQTITLGEVYKYSSVVESAVNASSKLSMATSQANSVFSWGSSFLTASIHSMRSQIVEDMMADFYYMNIRFPPNVINYQNYSQSPGNFLIPNALQKILDEVADDLNDLLAANPDDFSDNVDMGYSLNAYASDRIFLINFGETLTLFIAAFLVILVLEGVRRVLPKVESYREKSVKRRMRALLDSASYSFRWNFMVNQFIAVYLDLMFSSLLQVANGCDSERGVRIMEYVTGMVGLLASLAGVVGLFIMSRWIYLIKKRKQISSKDEAVPAKEKDILARFQILHEPFGSKRLSQLLYPFLLVLRCYIFVYVLILLPKCRSSSRSIR